MIPLDGTEIRHEINSVYNILAIINIPMVVGRFPSSRLRREDRDERWSLP